MEYERTQPIQVSADKVFAFVTNLENIPVIAPDIKSLAWVDDKTMNVQLQIGDDLVEASAYVSLAEEAHRHQAEWRIDELAHHGRLTVSPAGDASEVLVHLSVTPRVSESGRPLDSLQHDKDDPISKRLDAALDTLKERVEGHDETEKPAVS